MIFKPRRSDASCGLRLFQAFDCLDFRLDCFVGALVFGFYLHDEELAGLLDNDEVGKVAVIIAIGSLVFKVEIGFFGICQPASKQKQFYIFDGFIEGIQDCLKKIAFGDTVKVVRCVMQTDIVFIRQVCLAKQQIVFPHPLSGRLRSRNRWM